MLMPARAIAAHISAAVPGRFGTTIRKSTAMLPPFSKLLAQ